jgi:glycosyltransferase involved in cell wall biosynthesis
MAMEKPMVATKVAGSIDLVESGQNGWLVPVGDVEAFAAALTQVLNDADMRRRMGIAARIRAESFTRERMAKETLAIYTRA